MNPGDVLTLNIEKVAHGGFCIARHEGIVIFVRHALPNEKVEAKLISLAPGKKSWFAQTTKIINASKYRRESPCEYFHENGCGGCDFQHTTSSYQRSLKLEVLIEQLQRLGNVTNAREICRINAVEPEEKYWRTKIRVIANEKGEWGFRKFKDHQIQPIKKCLIADESINQILETLPSGQANEEISIVKSDEETIVIPGQSRIKNDLSIKRNVLGIDFESQGSGFWQVHQNAAHTLMTVVENESKKMEINNFLDLYSGVGILGRAILKNHPQAKGYAIESEKDATKSALANLKEFKVKCLSQKVDKWIFSNSEKFDLVVLDPPRSGAGVKVMKEICKKTLSKIIYIACDPASLARDVAVAEDKGWKLVKVDAYDFFPMTHHFESVAIFTRA